MISVVCPFYNEASILDAAVRSMLENLRSLDEEWELIIVNDGSTDGSLEIAQAFQADEPRLQGLTYPINRGRGYAIRTGAAAARGELIVTTKIDSSWGDDIVHRLVAELHARPDADIVVASPNLPGGRYKNVPIKRVFFSKYGNLIIRAGLRYSVTMNTGMTRGYRAEKFRALPLEEDEKEMHLEVINKALAFGYRIYEIPATLEWERPSPGGSGPEAQVLHVGEQDRADAPALQRRRGALPLHAAGQHPAGAGGGGCFRVGSLQPDQPKPFCPVAADLHFPGVHQLPHPGHRHVGAPEPGDHGRAMAGPQRPQCHATTCRQRRLQRRMTTGSSPTEWTA